MFAQINRDDEPSGGYAAFWVLLHQITATPGALIVSVGLIVPVVPVFGKTERLSSTVVISLLSLAVAFFMGYAAGRIFQFRARFGYWTWVLPTILWTYDFWSRINVYHVSFMGAVVQYFYGSDMLLTIPWFQSFTYSFGLRVGAKYNVSASARPLPPMTSQ
jgi:hypothetical protein